MLSSVSVRFGYGEHDGLEAGGDGLLLNWASQRAPRDCHKAQNRDLYALGDAPQRPSAPLYPVLLVHVVHCRCTPCAP